MSDAPVIVLTLVLLFVGANIVFELNKICKAIVELISIIKSNLES